ncbi:9196_t:CDS:2, partial [Entrophospora sp. SA101]
YCNTCGNGGQLMCCDSCPRAFHFTCLVPPLDIDNTPQGNWYCRVCCAEENPPSGPQGLFQELIERINNPINENNDNELINGLSYDEIIIYGNSSSSHGNGDGSCNDVVGINNDKGEKSDKINLLRNEFHKYIKFVIWKEMDENFFSNHNYI